MSGIPGSTTVTLSTSSTLSCCCLKVGSLAWFELVLVLNIATDVLEVLFKPVCIAFSPVVWKTIAAVVKVQVLQPAGTWNDFCLF